MQLNPRTRCPYTLKPLSELPAVSDEHVIPDALGCPASYSVRADTATNSTLGSTVDANLINDFLIRGLRHMHGVKSRSGPASMAMEGKTVDGDHPVQVILPHAAQTKVYFKKPFIPSLEGIGGTIVGAGDIDQKLEEVRKNYARKGMGITVQSRETLPNTTVHAQATINLTHQKVGLLKIAYLAAFEYLGDPFLDDPLNDEWQKAIRATELAEIEGSKIRGTCFEQASILEALLPKLKPHEHATVVMRVGDAGVVVGVKLFGESLLSLLCRVSETQTFGLSEIQGKIVICDSKSKAISVHSCEDLFLQKCGVVPSPQSVPVQDASSSSTQSPEK